MKLVEQIIRPARGLRRRRASTVAAGGAVIVIAAAIIVALVLTRGGDDGGSGNGSAASSAAPSSTTTSSPAVAVPAGASEPLGYLVDGVYHHGNGNTQDVPVQGVTAVSDDGAGGVYLLHPGRSGAPLSVLGHLEDGASKPRKLGCAAGLPVISPNGSHRAVATQPCESAGRGRWKVTVTGDTSGVMTTSDTPYLLGIDAAGEVTYYDYVSNEVLVVNPTETPAVPREVIIGAFQGYDSVHHLVFSLGNLAEMGDGKSQITTDGGGIVAVGLDNKVAWAYQDTSFVVAVSPDGSKVLATALPGRDGAFGAPVLDAASGKMVGRIDLTAQSKITLAKGWYDDERVLGQRGPDGDPRFVLLGLDGSIEKLTEPASTVGVVWESR